MNTTPTFSILITTKNRKDELLFTLNSLIKSINNDVKIVVYDDGSSDGTSEMVKELFPTVHLFRNEISKGLIACRNLMLNNTKSEFAISLDDDSHFISEDYVQEIADFFNKNQDCGVIGFRVFWGKQLPNTIDSEEEPFRVKSFVGCGHAWRMRAWATIPNYPEWFVFYGEEDFASYHLFKNNWKICYNPAIFVQHRVNVLSRKSQTDYKQRQRRSLRAGWYLYFLFYPVKVIPKKIAYSLYSQIKSKTLKADFKATLAMIQAIFDVLLNLPKLIRQSNRLSNREYAEYQKLAESRIYWTPNE